MQVNIFQNSTNKLIMFFTYQLFIHENNLSILIYLWLPNNSLEYDVCSCYLERFRNCWIMGLSKPKPKQEKKPKAELELQLCIINSISTMATNEQNKTYLYAHVVPIAHSNTYCCLKCKYAIQFVSSHFFLKFNC